MNKSTGVAALVLVLLATLIIGYYLVNPPTPAIHEPTPPTAGLPTAASASDPVSDLAAADAQSQKNLDQVLAKWQEHVAGMEGSADPAGQPLGSAPAADPAAPVVVAPDVRPSLSSIAASVAPAGPDAAALVDTVASAPAPDTTRTPDSGHLLAAATPTVPATDPLALTAIVATPVADATPAPAAVVPASPSTRPQSYTVKAGDTLSSIAIAVYGKASHWTLIAQANPTLDPKRLAVGQTLKLPELLVRSADAGPAATAHAPEPGSTIHVVREGETLWTIAQQHYQDGKLWRPIFKANQQLLGGSPDHVRVGMNLAIPPKPAAR